MYIREKNYYFLENQKKKDIIFNQDWRKFIKLKYAIKIKLVSFQIICFFRIKELIKK